MTTRIIQTLADLLVGAFFRLDFWVHKPVPMKQGAGI